MCDFLLAAACIVAPFVVSTVGVVWLCINAKPEPEDLLWTSNGEEYWERFCTHDDSLED